MNRNTIHPHASRGMTIIEVLASIIVALVGVLGVMILIPFAVRQAQTGMDTEAASTVARNAYHQFELWGYRNPDNWLVWNAGAGQVIPLNGRYPVSIDPLGITESAGDYVATTFPFNVDPPSYPANLEIPAANLRLPPPPNDPALIIPMEKGDARRMCRAADDLSFGDSQNSTGQNDAALNGPAQLFDTLGGNPVKRQAAGRFSWSAIAIPSGSANWKINFLVYRDRVTDVTAQDSVTINYAQSPKMRAAEVTYPAPAAISAPVAVSNITIGAAIPDQAMKRDDWVMLINQDPAGNLQIGFYRVVSFYSITATSASLTLDGPDFNFGTPTQVVHLKNVVGVYERTIVPEESSSWNITY